MMYDKQASPHGYINLGGYPPGKSAFRIAGISII